MLLFIFNVPLLRSYNIETYLDIQRKLLPTKMCSYAYMLTLVTYFLVPVLGFFSNAHLVPFKTIFHYDLDIWYFYLPTLCLTLWIGVAVVSHLAAESNLLATIILHLNARYLHLQSDLKELQTRLASDMKLSTDKVLGEYRREFIEIVKRNVEYNDFAQKFQNQYSFCIFVMMAFSAVLLCVLAFKAATVRFDFGEISRSFNAKFPSKIKFFQIKDKFEHFLAYVEGWGTCLLI